MAEKKRAIALGFFDGVHLGHGELLNMTKLRAQEQGILPSVLSFDIHPDTLVFNSDIKLLNSADDRKDIIKRIYGIDDLIFVHFDRHMMCMPWKKFLDSIIDELNVGWVVMGHDFCCGYRGEGKAELIKDYCAQKGIGSDIIPAKYLDGRIISSTWIRQLVAEGDMEQANRLLGHPHTFSDTVHSGYHLGRKLGSPTINMFFHEGVIIPRHGVYATRVYMGGESYNAVTNIGVRPSVSEDNIVSVESHLLNFSGNLYGRQARVEFFKFLRPEKKFDSFDELSAQIERDIGETTEYFKSINRHSYK